MYLENETLTIQEHEGRRREEEISGGGCWIRWRVNAASVSPVPESQQGVEEIESED
jgi:hypothetical protein